VKIYQGVTLGARSFPLDEAGNPIKGIPRHPIIEDDVVIYANATVLAASPSARDAWWEPTHGHGGHGPIDQEIQ
jgi:serine O-acetyltransferase